MYFYNPVERADYTRFPSRTQLKESFGPPGDFNNILMFKLYRWPLTLYFNIPNSIQAWVLQDKIVLDYILAK